MVSNHPSISQSLTAEMDRRNPTVEGFDSPVVSSSKMMQYPLTDSHGTNGIFTYMNS